MLLSEQRDRIDMVLVSPRNPLNIGAAARAMANFGFSRMSVVAPYAPHWREARSAVGAPELLLAARETNSLAEAVAEATLVLGTGTREHRKPEQRVILLPELPPFVQNELKRNGRIALIFGPEKHGLTRDDLSFCHALVEIPTAPNQPSMNLGQAVAVCLYELATHTSADARATGTSPDAHGEPGTHGPGVASNRLELLTGVVEQVMETVHYSPAAMRKANHHDLQLLLRRLALKDKDVRRMVGLFRRILWRLKR